MEKANTTTGIKKYFLIIGIICLTSLEGKSQCTAPGFYSYILNSGTLISLNYTYGLSGTYYMEYGYAGFTPGTNATPGIGGTIVVVPNTGSYTLGVADGNASYDFYLRRGCAGAFSPNSTKMNVVTHPCAPVVYYGQLGSTSSISYSGRGFKDEYLGFDCISAPFYLWGQETILRFTPPDYGYYTITVDNPNTSYYYGFLAKWDSYCSFSNWICYAPYYTSPNGITKMYQTGLMAFASPVDLIFDSQDSSSGFGNILSRRFDITITNCSPIITQHPSNAFVCAGGNTSFSVTATGSGLTYQWQENGVDIINGGVYGGATSPVLTLTGVPSNFDLRQYHCNINGCSYTTGSTHATLSVGAVSTPAIAISGPAVVCAGALATFSAMPMNAGMSPTYEWKKNGIVVATNVLNYSTNSLVTGDVITCTLTTNDACSQASATSNPITITVNPLPVAVITAGGPTTFCSSGSVTLNANTGSGLTYQWKLNGTAISGATGSSYTTGSAGSYTCLLTNACGSTTSNSITLTISTAPVASITAAGPTTFCAGGSVQLNANAGSGLVYQWRRNSSAVGGATNVNYIASVQGSYDCVVSNSCGNTTSNAISITVNSAPASPGPVSGQASGVCASSETYSVGAVAGASGYTWTVPSEASIINGQGTTSVDISFTSAFGGGAITVVATNGCGSSGASAIAVTGTPAQPGPISGPVSVCRKQNNVIYSIASVPSASSYTWTVPPGTQIKTGQGTNSIKVRFGNSGGNFTVKANNSCGSGTVRTLAVAMPCRETDASIEGSGFGILLFPNPSNRYFNLQVDIPDGNYFTVKIVDMVGRIAESFQDVPVNTTLVFGEGLPEGIYFAEIISGDDKRVVKLIKNQ